MRIFASMVADLFHAGHISFLEKIKKLYPDSTIIIGLHTDESVAKYKRKPIMTYDERYKLLETNIYVNEIFEFSVDLIIDESFLKKYNINYVVHAHSIEEEDKYTQLFKNIPNNFIRLDYTKGISTTEIINRIRNI